MQEEPPGTGHKHADTLNPSLRAVVGAPSALRLYRCWI